jgi:hypothetical protein
MKSILDSASFDSRPQSQIQAQNIHISALALMILEQLDQPRLAAEALRLRLDMDPSDSESHQIGWFEDPALGMRSMLLKLGRAALLIGLRGHFWTTTFGP